MTETIDALIGQDQHFFLWLNGMHSPPMDTLMWWITYKYTWIPMYLVLAILTLREDRRKGLFILLTVVIAVIVADKITSGLMKPYYMRFRPCHEPALQGLVHQVTDCGGLYGFASSHASTSFALAITWFVLLKNQARYIWLLLIWAFIYSYSRVYVGVHYPGDILVGALVGLACGWASICLNNIFLKRFYLN
jgi:undecaprenyl-diphosphatase